MKDLDPFTRWLVWVLSAGLLAVFCATVVGVQLWIIRQHTAFLSTTSPQQTYIVDLKGNKRRPFIIPKRVRADVFKSGQPFASDIWLHSALDAFDLSFEAGFPDVRWVAENTVEFYRAEYYEKGIESLLVSNNTDKSIKYLRVQAVNKFLLFDIQPGTSVSLKIPASRGESQWIAVQGVFTDGAEIPFTSKNLNRRSSQRQPTDYELVVTSSTAVISAR